MKEYDTAMEAKQGEEEGMEVVVVVAEEEVVVVVEKMLPALPPSIVRRRSKISEIVAQMDRRELQRKSELERTLELAQKSPDGV